MAFIKLIKLLYLAERKAVSKWGIKVMVVMNPTITKRNSPLLLREQGCR